ncbi:MAG: M20 family metallopeptidase [Deltaproteobacteria bacterium]|nr:M20 family metallopeptidase [Deltaproteobacteria bacterium]
MSANEISAVELAQQLIRLDSANPPGGEAACARLLGELLERGGFEVSCHDFAHERTSLVARLAGPGGDPLGFTGHLDTVPGGQAPWSFDPLAGEIDQGRLLGRGASDMKSGVAAVVAAALRLAGLVQGRGGLLLVFTAGEETGCVGAEHLAQTPGALSRAGGLVVAEPTSNYPFIGHKGALWLEATLRGKAAHGSMPKEGVNAIEKAARAINSLAGLDFGQAPHPQLGRPTLNVGTIQGGTKINIVPDYAAFTLDVRTLPGQFLTEAEEIISKHLGGEVELRRLLGADAVWTPEEDRWVQEVFAVMADLLGQTIQPKGATYFTDASSLVPALGGPPTIILGPGEAVMAHQTDEYCLAAKIEEAVEAYFQIGRRWLGL